ncbi:MAG TPA: S8/S53 family peptidase [Actinomycetota bacterium]|nr:S8/S53 family peptidase [Actinomycetota bacterium]
MQPSRLRAAVVPVVLALIAALVTPSPAVALQDRPVTVVAVVDSGFSPYHYDFLGSQHPWNTDSDPGNDLDFSAHPSTYVEGHPGAERLDLTLPGSATADVDQLRGVDSAKWNSFGRSTTSQARMYWMPGTKVIGAVRFGGERFEGSNSAHGTRSAASAAGNLHGTCPECLFVLVSGMLPEALAWAMSQPWIDVVTNSYGHSTTPLRDNVYRHGPVQQGKAASEAGQVVVFSAGNGLANAFDVPAFTYWSSEKGPDWVVTVGAVSPDDQATYSGAGKPVDISSIGRSYPSTGGSLAEGTGTHSGTSNAAPVVAGYFGRVLQSARETLGDLSAGHAAGVVAQGEPVTCGTAHPSCPLGDGVLTRAELQDLVFHNVLPDPGLNAAGVASVQGVPHAYYYQGHGAVLGRLRGSHDWLEEAGRMIGASTGVAAPPQRPAGERNWFVVDSMCRQGIWGDWTGGYYTGSAPDMNPIDDPLATSFRAGCSAL